MSPLLRYGGPPNQFGIIGGKVSSRAPHFTLVLVFIAALPSLIS